MTTTEVGGLLRAWRQRRRLSQLELSSRAEVSGRHLSFVETGRSRPSPDMILRLAEHLDVPLRERDALLLAGGYAPRFASSAAPDGAVLASFRALLDAHMPYPAVLLDRYWDLVDANPGVAPFLAGCAAHLLEPPVNVVRLSLHPEGLAPRIVGAAAWRAQLLQQVAARADRTADPRLFALLEECRGYAIADGDAPAPPSGPVLELVVRADDGAPLRLFTVASEVLTPNDVTVDELHLETFLPADDETRRRLAEAGT
ncbi:helix-turn-helix transcriptional regulator [Tsukamurella sp. 8F]|uniref:helix-turn-helix domain-containing protein n=1 Tax=unclassified Tsukamurella TaxID=2633480 RepID=UPI0023B9E58D|nr:MULTISPECIES: helix-turn-helix transcriptional regulator [unclassified Tsukamurella]MDF0530606.1 helix-turn-helix transcriptional regulator [Tsukamurella sp. 8J]MDF0587807.1 helix-turn-helix transcriptional regulator [Tsukamurella sp. 8F]